MRDAIVEAFRNLGHMMFFNMHSYVHGLLAFHLHPNATATAVIEPATAGVVWRDKDSNRKGLSWLSTVAVFVSSLENVNIFTCLELHRKRVSILSGFHLGFSKSHQSWQMQQICYKTKVP